MERVTVLQQKVSSDLKQMWETVKKNVELSGGHMGVCCTIFSSEAEASPVSVKSLGMKQRFSTFTSSPYCPSFQTASLLGTDATERKFRQSAPAHS